MGSNKSLISEVFYLSSIFAVAPQKRWIQLMDTESVLSARKDSATAILLENWSSQGAKDYGKHIFLMFSLRVVSYELGAGPKGSHVKADGLQFLLVEIESQICFRC